MKRLTHARSQTPQRYETFRLSFLIIVNLMDAVTWSVVGFQVFAEPAWKKHGVFAGEAGASARSGIKGSEAQQSD